MGSGCDRVGRAVASEIRRSGFESSHKEFLMSNYRVMLTENEAGNGY